MNKWQKAFSKPWVRHLAQTILTLLMIFAPQIEDRANLPEGTVKAGAAVIGAGVAGAMNESDTEQ